MEAVHLTPTMQRFILHFGEMGGRWGINRTVGQIYALLYLSPEPLNAEQITETLSFSRSNVSIGLKELQAWNLVRLQHVPGDRRDYFSTPDDIWEIVRTLVEERKRREIDPTVSMLREVMLEAPQDPNDRHVQAKVQEMHDLFELLTGWYDEVRQLDNDRLASLLRLGATVQQVLKFKDRVSERIAIFPGRGRGAGGDAAEETAKPNTPPARSSNNATAKKETS